MIRMEVKENGRGMKAFVAKMNAAPDKLYENAHKAVEVTSIKVRDDARAHVPGKGGYFQHLPRAIRYKIRKQKRSIVSRIFAKNSGKPQARFIGITNNGGKHGLNPARMFMENALDNHVEEFRRGMEQAVRDSIR